MNATADADVYAYGDVYVYVYGSVHVEVDVYVTHNVDMNTVVYMYAASMHMCMWMRMPMYM